MKVGLYQQFVNADGTPAKLAGTEDPVTLKLILIQTLLGEASNNDEKPRRYSLYRDIQKAKVPFVLLSAEDIAFLKKALLVQPVLNMGQAHDMLETAYIEPPRAYAKPKSNPDDYQEVKG